jgi:hypothetical protein
MSSGPSTPFPHKVGLFQLVDWRFVATIGLPIWAFLIGAVLMHRTAPAAPAPAPTGPTAKAAVPPPPAPAQGPPAVGDPGSREVVIREVQTVPVIVPVPAPADPLVAVPAGAGEFKLPASEVTPGGLCRTYDTKINFHPDLPTAAEEAKHNKKMLLVLHISGNFDDPGFT